MSFYPPIFIIYYVYILLYACKFMHIGVFWLAFASCTISPIEYPTNHYIGLINKAW